MFFIHYKAHDADNLDLPPDDIDQCLINNQIIETNDDDKHSTSSPEVKQRNTLFSFLTQILLKLFLLTGTAPLGF